MISVTDLRAGSSFIEGKDLFKVLKYEHVKMGRGTANIKIKAKNMRSGSITEKSFISGARVQEAILDKKEVQYLYREGNNYFFMNPVSFEQISVPEKLIADEAKYLKEGMTVTLQSLDDEPLSLELPIKMDFRVSEADPGVRGNSATNIYKDAVLENGLHIKVPLFIEEGELIRVDTRNGEYVERAK